LTSPPSIRVPAVDELITDISTAVAQAKQNLAAAQHRQKQDADKRRRHETFKPGDKVMLSTDRLSG